MQPAILKKIWAFSTSSRNWLVVGFVFFGAYAFMRMGGEAEWSIFLRLSVGLLLMLIPLGICVWAWDRVPQKMRFLWRGGLVATCLLGFPLLVLWAGWGVNDLLGNRLILLEDSRENRLGIFIWLLAGGLGLAILFGQRFIGRRERQGNSMPLWRPRVLATCFMMVASALGLMSTNLFQDASKDLAFWPGMSLFLGAWK